MAKERRQGRGHLSSIEIMLGENPDAEPDVGWAYEQLRDRTLPQKVILEELNHRLADRGIDPISKSSFSRHAVRKAIQWRKHDEVNRIAKEVLGETDPESPDQVTVLVAEMVKIACYELLERGEVTTKGAQEISRALSAAVSAQKGSAEYRRMLEQRAAKQVEKALDRAEEMAREGGLGADRIAQLRREFLGVKTGDPQ